MESLALPLPQLRGGIAPAPTVGAANGGGGGGAAGHRADARKSPARTRWMGPVLGGPVISSHICADPGPAPAHSQRSLTGRMKLVSGEAAQGSGSEHWRWSHKQGLKP